MLVILGHWRLVVETWALPGRKHRPRLSLITPTTTPSLSARQIIVGISGVYKVLDSQQQLPRVIIYSWGLLEHYATVITKKKKEAPTKVSLSFFFFFSYSLLFFLFSPRLDIKKTKFPPSSLFFFFQIFLLLSLILAFYLFINRCLISVNLLFNSSVITIYYLAYNHGSHLLFPDRKSKIKYFGVIYPVLTVQSPGRPAPLRGWGK